MDKKTKVSNEDILVELRSIKNLLILLCLKQNAKVIEVAKVASMSPNNICKLVPQKKKSKR